MLFQSAEIFACRNFEGNQNVFVGGSRDLPLKTILIPTCIGCLVTVDIRPVMKRLTCKDIDNGVSVGAYLKVDVVNKSKFILKSLTNSSDV